MSRCGNGFFGVLIARSSGPNHDHYTYSDQRDTQGLSHIEGKLVFESYLILFQKFNDKSLDKDQGDPKPKDESIAVIVLFGLPYFVGDQAYDQV